MTKSDYMNTLQERLHRYNVAIEKEILEDYEQHFVEGLAQGRTEEEIIAELGNIEDMLQEFSEEDMKQELETVATQSSQSNSYERIYREVVIDGLLADVEVCDSGDDQIRIDYENRGSKAQKLRYDFYQYEENGVFYAGVRERKGADMGADFFRGFFSRANWSGGDIDLRVEIPAGIPVVRLQTTSGDLNIQGIKTGELEAQCSSGDLNLNNATCERLQARVVSGDMEISGVYMDVQKDSEVELHTTSGDIEITGVSASHMYVQSGSGSVAAGNLQADHIEMKSGSGELELENVQVDLIQLETGSGDVDASRIRGRELNVGTGSGDAALNADMEIYDIKTGSGDLDLQADVRAKQIHLAAGSGDINLDTRHTENVSIETHTASGDTCILGQEFSGRSNSHIHGNGACQVRIVTGSGDINVN